MSVSPMKLYAPLGQACVRLAHPCMVSARWIAAEWIKSLHRYIHTSSIHILFTHNPFPTTYPFKLLPSLRSSIYPLIITHPSTYPSTIYLSSINQIVYIFIHSFHSKNMYYIPTSVSGTVLKPEDTDNRRKRCLYP